jgi:hypothetical protein
MLNNNNFNCGISAAPLHAFGDKKGQQRASPLISNQG